MTKSNRRNFLTRSSAAAAGASWAALADPAGAAAQTVGVKAHDFPDLTIKEAKLYQTDLTGFHSLNGERGEVASLTTASGLEALYTLGNRNSTPHWLEWAKARLVGKTVMDLLPTISSTSGLKATYGFNANGRPPGFEPLPKDAMLGDSSVFITSAVAGSALQMHGGGNWPNWYTACADVLLWDLLGQTVNKPIYKILNGGVGGTKDRVMAYASSAHHPAIEDYAPEAVRAKAMNFKGYKIHPGPGQHRGSKSAIPAYVGHIEEIRQVRAAVGDEFVLAHDPVQAYNRYEAMAVGKVLDELDYAWFEDPIRTTDMDGLIALNAALGLPLHVGEFLYSIADFAEYISKGALNVARLIADNVGGISGGMRIGLLADAFNVECTPHNWGNAIDIMLHFHLELALPNCFWFELPMPPETADHPFMKTRFRPDAEGYIHAPTLPGMGVEIDRAEMDRRTKNILR
ncbi:MAG TPA: mandelate racemase/muconate lactonizing enzyme family protein [Rhizomicrobium sp.]|nr:mandelate racemase/muconate lactonizing enzyme family protein [Rhizomicrobium sp.]